MDTNIISALGGGSGIDTTSLVKQLVEVERAPQQNRLDSKKEQLEAQISAYGLLKSSLSEFQNILAPLGDNDTFNSRSVSFPETDVITPNTLDADAQTGTYQVRVEEVALSHTVATNYSTSDKDAALNATGNLIIKLGTWTYSDVPPLPTSTPVTHVENENQNALNIEVAADDSLQDIADKINAADSEVQASVLLVDGEYQLMMSAPSGKDNALEITNENDSGSFSLNNFAFNSGNFGNVTETQKGQDAELYLNGLQVFRDSNEISDVIQGLSFTINKASPGDNFTFSVNEDTATAEQAIRDFVEAYNTFYETAKSLVGISTDAETNVTKPGDLSTDGSAKTVLSQIRNVLTAAVPGVDGSNGFNALTNIGIRTQLDGTLEITDDFADALTDNFDQIKNIFAPQTSSSSNYVDVSIGSYASKTVPGTYSGTVSAAPSKGSIIGDLDVVVPLDTAAAIPPDDDFSFNITVDGTESGALALSGEFNTAEELRAGLQSAINNDTAIKDARAFVDVLLEGNKIKIVSRQYGSSSNVDITAAGDEFTTATGLADTSVSTNGTDTAGTINGDAAFGSGNILLPKIDTDPYGLNLTIKEGASGDFTFTFSRGLAGELTSLIDSFLQTDGAIKTREENINKQLSGIEVDQEELDRKMEIVESRLTQQYLAMERVIASLSTTGNSLDGILDRLPFTAKSN